MTPPLTPPILPMRFVLGTTAYNTHVQQMARALYEASGLFRYVTGGVDVFRRRPLVVVRRQIARRLPALDAQLARRRVEDLPAELIHTRWHWEFARVLAAHQGAVPRLEDWLWERGERSLDAHCARLVARRDVGGFFGVEFGALEALRAARQRGKVGVLAFLSPHHATRAQWVDVEFDRYPDLRSANYERLARLGARRDALRDEEASSADWIVSNSSFTTRSLVDAGIDAARIITVPLGGPTPMPAGSLPARPAERVTFVYVGPVSVRKGAHYLLDAWREMAPPRAELHFYGKVLLPPHVIRMAQSARGGESIHFHGSVPSCDLPAIYRYATVLVLPTLCDGFGQVISDALAHGLPVITTSNAGGADCVLPGHTGFVIPPANATALAAAIDWCASHPERLFDMRGAALASARLWTWRDFRAKLARLLVDAVTGRTTPEGERA